MALPIPLDGLTGLLPLHSIALPPPGLSPAMYKILAANPPYDQSNEHNLTVY